MENNFFNYITKQLNKEEVDIWFRTNNIIPEKMELYYDFCNSLYLKITETYLGDSENGETKILMSDEDKEALEWANANPKDPRSKEIKSKLGF